MMEFIKCNWVGISAIGAIVGWILTYFVMKRNNNIAQNMAEHSQREARKREIEPYLKWQYFLKRNLEEDLLSTDEIESYIKDTDKVIEKIIPFDMDQLGVVHYIRHMLIALKTIPFRPERQPLKKLIIDTLDASLKNS